MTLGHRIKSLFTRDEKPEHLRRGELGEQAAKRFLKKQGLKFLAANFSSDRGEIDLVCRDCDCLVFVEVKTRSSENWVRPAAAVNKRKRQLLSQTALDYLRLLKNPQVKVRFDIVEVLLTDGAVREVRHLPNTFTMEKPYRYRLASRRMRFAKYHALGNDYLVIDPKDLPSPLTTEQVKVICHRNFGVGSDGILLGSSQAQNAKFALRIFNPDGSEAEKSGNGLRIFSRYLWDRKLVGNEEFTIQTAGGVVRSTVFDGGKMVRVEMGKITFWSNEIPVTGPRREVINEKISVGGKTFTFCAAAIGNPHCVLPLPEISADMARQFGPLIETHANFPNRTNVQFLKVRDRRNIQIEIWERGAGHTLASGSSSSAAAAVAHKLGLCDRSISVHMPGGVIAIEIGDDFAIQMTGPVTKVGEGTIDPDIFSNSIPV